MSTEDLKQLFEKQCCRSPLAARRTVAERRELLRRLRGAVEARHDQIVNAINADLGRPPFETETSEIHHVLREIGVAIRQLPNWMRGRPVRTPLLLTGTTSRLMVEPRGTVLVIAPWNYPFGLIVNPLVAALAAGNCAVVKPSEKAPATAQLIGSMISDTFSEEDVAVVMGGPDVAARLLELPFDHFFFTGSATVGRKVMQAAANHLSTVTLELGGKTPAVVDESADIATAAERIAWGKFFNAGQTCLAPDYVLAHQSHAAQLVEALNTSIARFYGASEVDRRESLHFGRIVDAEHFDRLVDLVERSMAMGAVLEIGGKWDRDSRYVSPTVLSQVTGEMPVMQEEIFGPVLPVLTYDDRQDAIRLARCNGKPLGSYVFARDRRAAEYFVRAIPSGGTVVNNTLLHYASSDLPFGGVGASGLGSYHGYHGFLAMSHVRPVVQQREPALAKFLFPPYSGRVHALVRRVIPWLR
jgi:aldehyde dehydrogenase (NAD+)